MRGKLKPETKRRSVSACRKGLTLTEVVVASSLLATAIVPMLRGMSNSHMVSAAVEQKTHALIMAQAKMEEIKARAINNYSANFGENNSSLTGSYLCNVSDSPGGPNIRTITVSVGYNDDGNNVLSAAEIDVQLSTKIAKRI